MKENLFLERNNPINKILAIVYILIFSPIIFYLYKIVTLESRFMTSYYQNLIILHFILLIIIVLLIGFFSNNILYKFIFALCLIGVFMIVRIFLDDVLLMHKDISNLENKDYIIKDIGNKELIEDITYHKPRNESTTYLYTITIDDIKYQTDLLKISEEKYESLSNETKIVIHYLPNSKYVMKLDIY